MSEDANGGERCATCDRDAGGLRAYCRFYLADRRVVLCCPMCAEKYLRGPQRGASNEPPRDFIEELVEELRWTHCGYGAPLKSPHATDDHQIANPAEPGRAKAAIVRPHLRNPDFLPHENRSCAC